MLLTTTEAAKLAGVTSAAIAYFRQTNRLPSVKLLGKHVFSQEQIEAFIKARGNGFPHTGRPRKAKAQ
jgi:hypothetical protein